MPFTVLSNIAGERKRSRWKKARLSLLLPIGTIVAIAIVCVVVAVLTSAQRANEVSLTREPKSGAPSRVMACVCCANSAQPPRAGGISFATLRSEWIERHGCHSTVTTPSWS